MGFEKMKKRYPKNCDHTFVNLSGPLCAKRYNIAIDKAHFSHYVFAVSDKYTKSEKNPHICLNARQEPVRGPLGLTNHIFGVKKFHARVYI